MDKFIGLKELRENVEKYAKRVKKGESIIVLRRSVPLFKISPVEEKEDEWEEVIDFTKIKRGGVDIKEILSRI
jgi:prevent-host-death family protein